MTDTSLSEPVFVGREGEKQVYQHLLTEATPWVLIITGQAGVGKSTLLRHLATSYTPQEIVVGTLNFADLSLRVDPLHVLSALSWQFASSCDAKRVVAFEKTLAEGHNRLSELSIRTIQLLTVGEHETAQEAQFHTSTASLYGQRYKVHKMVKQAFYYQMDTFRPSQLVIMLDSCEWLNEPESLGLGHWVMNELLPDIRQHLMQEHRKCTVVIASRLSLDLAAIDEQERRHLILPMLDRAAVNDYLRCVGMQNQELHQRVYDLTHGHALCVSIIATLWGEQPFSIATLPILQEQFTEQALLKFVGERILDERLKSPFRELTRYGVVLRSFNLPMLQAVFPHLHIEYEQFCQFIRYPYVESLGNHRYVVHSLLREIQAGAIREQEPKQWQAYHRRALDYLTSLQSQQSDRYYHTIALSQEEGMSDWWNAIQSASIRHAQEEFSALLDVAQDPTLKLTSGNLAKCIQWQGNFYRTNYQMDGAIASYEDAMRLYQQVGDRLGEANVRKAVGDVQQFRKDMDVALGSYEEALTLFRQVGSKLGEANVLRAIGDVQQFRDEREAALGSYEQALTLFRQVGSKLGEANVLQAMGDVQQFRKDMDTALGSYEEALTLFRQVGDRLGEANVLQSMGGMQQFRNEREAALGSYEQALVLFRQVGDRLGEANVLQATGDVQQFHGEHGAALASYEQAFALFRQIGSKLGEANVLRSIGDVQQFRDEREAALGSYEQALTLFRQVGSKLGEANVLQAMGDVQQFRKDMDTALGSYEEALTLFRQIGSKLGEANVLQAIGDVQQFRDEREAALGSYEQALTLFRQVGSKLGVANVLRAMGDVQQFRKDMDAALGSYEEALTLFRQVDSKLGEANCYLALGRVALEVENYQRALTLYTNAYHLYQQIQDHYSQVRSLYYRSFVYEAMDEVPLAIRDMENALIGALILDLPFVELLEQCLDALRKSVE